MKQVTVSELREGDIFFHEDSYSIVTSAKRTTFFWFPSGGGSTTHIHIQAKCFMSPSNPTRVGIGTVYHPSIDLEVLLCEREDIEIGHS